jgi:hypothetical protein
MYILVQRTSTNATTTTTYKLIASFGTLNLAIQAIEDIKTSRITGLYEDVQVFQNGIQIDSPAMSWVFQIVEVPLSTMALTPAEIRDCVLKARGLLR